MRCYKGCGEQVSMDEMDELIANLKKADQEREANRKEMERLTLELSKFDNECLGAAVKCYILGVNDTNTSKLTDAACEALSIIAKVLLLEWEC